jgi:drug/metabolite transporter (DMT)-like permease
LSFDRVTAGDYVSNSVDKVFAYVKDRTYIGIANRSIWKDAFGLVLLNNRSSGPLIMSAGYLLFGFVPIGVQLGTIMSLMVPVIATLAGWIFLGETITSRFLVGALLILSACTAAGFLEKEAD